MKLVLLVTVAVMVQARFGELILQRFFKDALYELCDNPDTHILKASAIKIEPEQPTTGQDIIIEVHGNATKDITAGTIKAEIKFGFIKLNKELDFCQALEDYTDARCPLKQGKHVIKVQQNIPKEVPPLSVSGHVRAWDQNGDMISCVAVQFTFKRG